MCYICLTVLRKCRRFMETARDTNNVLKQWYNQQNKMREARPLFTYSISKVDVVSTYNGNISLQHEIKAEEVDLGVDEVQIDDLEYKTNVDIEKTDIDEQTNYSELLVDSPNDNTYTVEYNHDRQTNPQYNYKLDLEEISSIASNLAAQDHTNSETTIKIISPHHNEELLPIVLQTVANSETSNDITTLNSTPSQPDNTRQRNTKKKTRLRKNSFNSGDTAKLGQIQKTNEIRLENKRLAGNTIKNSNNSNKLGLNASNVDKNEINTCNYKTTARQLITRHVTSHTDGKPFTCEICNFKFKLRHHLKIHMRTHTGEKPFSCDFCNYKCKLNHHLKIHMRTHTGHKPFSCDICDYKFTQSHHLKTHMRTHTGEKPFSCHLCGKKYAQKDKFKTHMRTHTGEKPYSCDVCHHKFKDKPSLERHIMRFHTDKKPFSCDVCDYKSTQKCNLKTHMRTHTGEKRFTCDICDHKYTQKGQLVAHFTKNTLCGQVSRGKPRPRGKQ